MKFHNNNHFNNGTNGSIVEKMGSMNSRKNADTSFNIKINQRNDDKNINLNSNLRSKVNMAKKYPILSPVKGVSGPKTDVYAFNNGIRSEYYENNLSKLVKSLFQAPSKLNEVISFFHVYVKESQKFLNNFSQFNCVIEDFQELTKYNKTLLTSIEENVKVLEEKQRRIETMLY
jgi:hypothetical protein